MNKYIVLLCIVFLIIFSYMMMSGDPECDKIIIDKKIIFDNGRYNPYYSSSSYMQQPPIYSPTYISQQQYPKYQDYSRSSVKTYPTNSPDILENNNNYSDQQYNRLNKYLN